MLMVNDILTLPKVITDWLLEYLLTCTEMGHYGGGAVNTVKKNCIIFCLI